MTHRAWNDTLKRFGDWIAWADATSLALPAPRDAPMTAEAFGLGPLSIAPAARGGWVGRRDRGASVNADDAHFSIHSGGTHTECVAHIHDVAWTITDVAPLGLLWAVLLDIPPRIAKEQHIVMRADVEMGWQRIIPTLPDGLPITAAVVRSRASNETPHKKWSGTRPPYFAHDSLQFLADKGILHLVTDLPSVDPENDGGTLYAHRAFFGVSVQETTRMRHATITEMAWIPASLCEGAGVLRLDVLDWPSDAAPSRPVYYPFTRPDSQP